MRLSSEMRRIESRSDDQVWLSVGPSRWSGFSLALKRRFLAALDRLAEIRLEIAEVAKFKIMPPWTEPQK
jgi:hypothetical protein